MLNVLLLAAMVTSAGTASASTASASMASAETVSADKAPAGTAPATDSWLTTTGGLSLVAPSPYLALGGEYGLSAWDHLAAAGVDCQAFWLPLNRDLSLGLSLGSYLRLAPIPGDWGRRFYLHGKVNRTVAIGSPLFNSFGVGGGLGYRHPLDETPFGSPGFWYVETGLQRAFLFHYGEALFLVDALKTGFTF